MPAEGFIGWEGPEQSQLRSEPASAALPQTPQDQRWPKSSAFYSHVYQNPLPKGTNSPSSVSGAAQT